MSEVYQVSKKISYLKTIASGWNYVNSCEQDEKEWGKHYTDILQKNSFSRIYNSVNTGWFPINVLDPKKKSIKNLIENLIVKKFN